MEKFYIEHPESYMLGGTFQPLDNGNVKVTLKVSMEEYVDDEMSKEAARECWRGLLARGFKRVHPK